MGGWGVKNGKQKYYISSKVAASEGPAHVTNSAEQLIQLMTGWVPWSHFMQFQCNLLSSAPISNFSHDMLFVCFILFIVLCSFHHSDCVTTAKPFSHQQKTTHNTYYHKHTHTHDDRFCVLTKCKRQITPIIFASKIWQHNRVYSDSDS